MAISSLQPLITLFFSSVLPPLLEEADDETDDETDDPLDPDLASEERFHKILSDADQKGEHLTEHERTLMALRARIKALKRQQMTLK